MGNSGSRNPWLVQCQATVWLSFWSPVFLLLSFHRCETCTGVGSLSLPSLTSSLFSCTGVSSNKSSLGYFSENLNLSLLFRFSSGQKRDLLGTSSYIEHEVYSWELQRTSQRKQSIFLLTHRAACFWGKKKERNSTYTPEKLSPLIKTNLLHLQDACEWYGWRLTHCWVNEEAMKRQLPLKSQALANRNSKH